MLLNDCENRVRTCFDPAAARLDGRQHIFAHEQSTPEYRVRQDDGRHSKGMNGQVGCGRIIGVDEIEQGGRGGGTGEPGDHQCEVRSQRTALSQHDDQEGRKWN